jgi:anti-sigma factor RsiW
MTPHDPDLAPAPVTDDELHALVDGQLAPTRVAAVLAWLHTHADDAARVASWQTQRLQLRQLARHQALGEAPAALVGLVQRHAGLQRRRATWQQAMAAAVLLATGVGAGMGASHWWGRQAPPSSLASRSPAFVRDAALAYAVYSPEKRHPVEVTAAEQAHLVQWLSRRLGTPLKIPDLSSQGYHLLGGRLLPGEESPRAQFMYEDEHGARLTLYVAVFSPGQAPSPAGFQSVREGARQSFYWVEDRFGYALSAEAGAPQMQALAREVYRQLGG